MEGYLSLKMPWRSLTGVRFILHLPQSKMDSRLSVLSKPRSTFCTEMQTEHSSNKGSNELWNVLDGLNNRTISSTLCFVEFLIRCSIVEQGETEREHRSQAVPENETLQYCIISSIHSTKLCRICFNKTYMNESKYGKPFKHCFLKTYICLLTFLGMGLFTLEMANPGSVNPRLNEILGYLNLCFTLLIIYPGLTIRLILGINNLTFHTVHS